MLIEQPDPNRERRTCQKLAVNGTPLCLFFAVREFDLTDTLELSLLAFADYHLPSSYDRLKEWLPDSLYLPSTTLLGLLGSGAAISYASELIIAPVLHTMRLRPTSSLLSQLSTQGAVLLSSLHELELNLSPGIASTLNANLMLFPNLKEVVFQIRQPNTHVNVQYICNLLLPEKQSNIPALSLHDLKLRFIGPGYPDKPPRKSLLRFIVREVWKALNRRLVMSMHLHGGALSWEKVAAPSPEIHFRLFSNSMS